MATPRDISGIYPALVGAAAVLIPSLFFMAEVFSSGFIMERVKVVLRALGAI